MTLRVCFMVHDAHTVLGHGVHRTIVFVQCSNIMVHNGQDILGHIVNEGHGVESGFITHEGGLETRVNRVAVVVVNQIFLECGQGLTNFERRLCASQILADATVSIGVPAVRIRVLQSIGAIQGVEPEMDFPPVGNTVTKRGIERANGKTVPEVPVGIFQERVGPQPEVFPDGVDRTGRTSVQEIVERGIRSRWEVGPILQYGSFGQRSVAPKAVKFGGKVRGRPVSVFFRSRVPFGVAENSVSVDVKAIVIAVERQIATVERVERRARIPQSNRVKSTHSMTHVGLVSIGHAVTVGIGHTRVEVNTVAVLVQFSGQASWEAGCRTVRRVRPTELLGSVQPVQVSVNGSVRSVVLVESGNDDIAPINRRPIHPFFKQGFVDVGDQITVCIRIRRRRSVGIIGVNVGDIGNGGKLRHEQEARNNGKGGQDGCLTSSHELTVGKGSASLSFHLARIAYEGDGTMFIQIVVPNGSFVVKICFKRLHISVHSSPSRAGILLFT